MNLMGDYNFLFKKAVFKMFLFFLFFQKHKRIYLTLLDLETHYGTIEMEFIDKLFGAIQNDLSLETDFRLSCAQKKVEFYEEYSNDIDEIVKIQDEFLTERKKLEAKLKDDKSER